MRFICLILLLFSTSFLEAKRINESKIANPVIILDAGHGGRDLGAKIRYPHCVEKRLALTTTLLTKKYLNHMGYKVVLTRGTDLFVPLARRVYLANRSRPELFVSVHYNSCPNKTAHGIEIYFSDAVKDGRMKASQKLAKCILSEVISKTKSQNRGVKKANFYVIRETKMPAVLVEGGFITNPDERNKLRNNKYLEKIARGIAEGIDNYLKS